MVPATVVTGFLGAGKTTLLRHLIENAGGRRLALIINEFGDLGIDGQVLRNCGVAGCTEDDIVELTNGCICCRVADEFVPTLERLLDRPEPPEHILIETSGLALPQPVVKAFRWGTVAGRATVGAVVTVVDGPAVRDGKLAASLDELRALQAQEAAGRRAVPAADHDDPIGELFEDQLRAADLVIINKIDLLGAEERRRVEEQVRAAVGKGTRLASVIAGRLPADLIFGLANAAEGSIDEKPSHADLEREHDHDDFASFAVRLGESAGREALEARIIEAIGRFPILRLKGFAAIAGKPKRLMVQIADGRLDTSFERAWAEGEERRADLVVIGEKGLDQAGIEAVLRG